MQEIYQAIAKTGGSLASVIEHTLLRADATPADIEAHCREAADSGLLAVCVQPVHVRLARTHLVGTAVRVVTVAGFPLGANTPAVKAEEAARAVSDGAHEIDMVMAIGLGRGGEWEAVEADVRAVREAVPNSVLKVILETGYFDADAMRRAAEAAVRAGAEFVKTSTGLGPRGATVDDVRLLFDAVRGRAGVKASGGVRTREAALRLIEAGAMRIGTSEGVALACGA